MAGIAAFLVVIALIYFGFRRLTKLRTPELKPIVDVKKKFDPLSAIEHDPIARLSQDLNKHFPYQASNKS